MTKMNRRNFLGAALGSGLAMNGLLGRAGAGQPSEPKIKLGVIGCGNYGMANIRAAFKAGGIAIIALCDVDSQHLKDSADRVEQSQGTRPKTFKHEGELLETPGLDAIVIATPPQWHALPFIPAVEKGLDVYCEKPLAYDVREGRAMVDAARKKGVIVQVGFQRRQSPAIQQAREHIRQGHLGRIIEAEAQIHYTAGMRDTTPQDPPASLDWDLWCGPAPKLPYSPAVGHHSWRWEQTTGNGHLVDWGIHLIDAIRYVLGETVPRRVTSSGGIYVLADHVTTPDILTTYFEFATCPVIWTHRMWGAAEPYPDHPAAITFCGENETILYTDREWTIIPKKAGAERAVHTGVAYNKLLPAHVGDWVRAVHERRPPACVPEDGHQSTTAVQLAMIAYQTGRPINWDARREMVTGEDSAAPNALLKREYRPPWKHPHAG